MFSLLKPSTKSYHQETFLTWPQKQSKPLLTYVGTTFTTKLVTKHRLENPLLIWGSHEIIRQMCMDCWKNCPGHGTCRAFTGSTEWRECTKKWASRVWRIIVWPHVTQHSHFHWHAFMFDTHDKNIFWEMSCAWFNGLRDLQTFLQLKNFYMYCRCMYRFK